MDRNSIIAVFLLYRRRKRRRNKLRWRSSYLYRICKPDDGCHEPKHVAPSSPLFLINNSNLYFIVCDWRLIVPVQVALGSSNNSKKGRILCLLHTIWWTTRWRKQVFLIIFECLFHLSTRCIVFWRRVFSVVTAKWGTTFNL